MIGNDQTSTFDMYQVLLKHLRNTMGLNLPSGSDTLIMVSHKATKHMTDCSVSVS